MDTTSGNQTNYELCQDSLNLWKLFGENASVIWQKLNLILYPPGPFFFWPWVYLEEVYLCYTQTKFSELIIFCYGKHSHWVSIIFSISNMTNRDLHCFQRQSLWYVKHDYSLLDILNFLNEFSLFKFYLFFLYFTEHLLSKKRDIRWTDVQIIEGTMRSTAKWEFILIPFIMEWYIIS